MAFIGPSLFLWLWLVAQHSTVWAQESSPKYEFRGVWIASVLNLDWPAQGVHPFFLESSINNMLDAHQEAGLNAVIFQVRPESDALYPSDLEPWSFWLTGEQGTAPDPFIDPLDLVLQETHRRGMELHAWFNPYRAIRGSGYENSPDHITVRNPEWTLTFGNLVLLNPGLQEVRDHVTNVIMDVIRRYDVDGVHFDDFFYPYPPNAITNQDAETFDQFNRGFTSIHDWRRDNVNLLVKQVSDSLKAVKPYLKFGISPFGIWRNGVPSGITGLDAANVIYGDALAWLEAETIDYIAPQLYWAFGGGQDYAKLAPWWASQRNGRHIYTGHGVYRSDANTFSGTLYSATEVPSQIRFNRAHGDIQGSIFFRSKNISNFSSKGFADTLATDLFRHPALPPVMEWKGQEPPVAPQNLAFTYGAMDELTLSWVRDPDQEGRETYAVYRVRSSQPPLPEFTIDDASNLLAVTGDTFLVDAPGIADSPYHYFVTSVSRNSIESEASNIVTLEGRAVAVEYEMPRFFEIYQNHPNPFSGSTEIEYRLARPAFVRLGVYNALGRQVTMLVDDERRPAGLHTVRWDGLDQNGNRVGSGTYYYVFMSEGYRNVKGMALVR